MDIKSSLFQSFSDFYTSLVSHFNQASNAHLSWDDVYNSIRHSPIFTHPPYLLAFLLCTLLPLLVFVDGLGSNPGKLHIAMATRQSSTTIPEVSSSEGQDIQVNNTPPSKAMLEKVAKLTVLDAKKKEHTFKSLYSKDSNSRVLIVFIRHFFCGNCQEYIRTLTRVLPPAKLAALPQPTTLLIVGCGTPDLIPMYVRETACPFAVYADPGRKLYAGLGMCRSLSLGSKSPEYMRKSVPNLVAKSVVQELKSGRNMLSGGDMTQVGGEFLFVAGSGEAGGRVVWCHRMRNTRDHAEMTEVMAHLGAS